MTHSSSRILPAAFTKATLTGLITASASLTLAVSATAGIAPPGINNPVSAFFHSVDGQFSDGVGVGEWSDVTPAAFISAPGATAIPVPFGTPGQNSLLFAGLGRTSPASEISLFLMYDFLPRTTLGGPIQPGELLASITFPVTLPAFPQFNVEGGDNTFISVILRGADFRAQSGPIGGGIVINPIEVLVDLNLDGTADVFASQIGITGAADFGPSPLSSTPHLLVELDVPLRIPAGFGAQNGPLPGNGINPATGLYDPDPAFWGAAANPDRLPAAEGDVAAGAPSGLQPASAANFTINPDGSTTVVPIPEPTSAGLLGAGLALLGFRRRKG